MPGARKNFLRHEEKPRLDVESSRGFSSGPLFGRTWRKNLVIPQDQRQAIWAAPDDNDFGVGGISQL